MRFLLLAGALLSVGALSGCGSGEASATKKDEANFRDRNPADFHPPPNRTGPPPGSMGAPPGAAGPPAGKG